jgi:hypothetical protein
VQPLAITDTGLDRMAKGMAEVEQGALTRFALIGDDHLGLVATRTTHRLGKRRSGWRDSSRSRLGSEPFEERQIPDQAVLDDFRQPGPQFPVRQRIQRVRIGQHEARLVESADHVLAQRVVDGGLASDRGVHLRQQGRGNLDKRHCRAW